MFLFQKDAHHLDNDAYFECNVRGGHIFRIEWNASYIRYP